MFPYLDLQGFIRRTSMAAGEVLYVENDSPGFTVQRIASRSSEINGRLRKRYGNAKSRAGIPGNFGKTGNSLPFGQVAPLLLGAGTDPPNIVLQGRPTLGSLQLNLSITTPGATGVAVFSWTPDGGITNFTAVPTAASVVLDGTGLTAIFPTQPPNDVFSADNVYAAAPPVPEIILSWLTILVTYDLYRKRGMNPADPVVEMLAADVTQVYADLKEAADSKDGLFDLPVSEDEDSAVTTGGPLGYSETSPYVWTDVEAHQGHAQDAAYRGFGFGPRGWR